MSDPSLFIDGKWRDAAGGGTREIRCPADGTPVRTVSEGGADDAVAAVLSARRAFDNGPWPRTTGPERAALLHRLADRLESAKVLVQFVKDGDHRLSRAEDVARLLAIVGQHLLGA